MKIFLHWLLIGLAALGMLVVLFYAEEDLRGWHAWNKFKHQWEAMGEKFDAANAVPPRVPDDQNFAMSPVWVAEIKNLWQGNPERAKAWYGNRIDDDEVSKLASLLPVSVSGLAGSDWGSKKLPATPETPGRWTTGMQQTWHRGNRIIAICSPQPRRREFPSRRSPSRPQPMCCWR